MLQIVDVFEEVLSDLKFDHNLAKEVYLFQSYFVSKNDDHLAFFGGHLTGVQVVRFSESDFRRWFDIFGIDALSLQEKLYEADAINRNFKVSSDVFNMLCMWLIHKFQISPYLDPKKRERAAMDVALVFSYRCITALMSHYYKYPADPKLAEAAYSRLTYRYLIKKLGTWQEVFWYRSQDLVFKEGLHYKTLIEFKDDFKIIDCVNDAQGRIRDMMKNIYAEFMKAHESGDRIKITSSTENNMEGDEVLADKTHGLENYIDYALTVINDPATFIKKELVDLVATVLPTLNTNKFYRLLEWITTDHDPKTHIDFQDLVRVTLVHSFSYLNENSYLGKHTKDLSKLMVGLKNAYTSSRNTDEELTEMRLVGERLIKSGIEHTSDQQISALRTGFFLYINIRAYTKHYYSH